MVMSARDAVSEEAKKALETLCGNYWYPLYAFLRRSGNPSRDAENLTREFFSGLLQNEGLALPERGHGRFRTFLIMALKRFLAKEGDRSTQNEKGLQLAPLDLHEAEARYLADPAISWPAEALYERRWALALLDQTMTRLRGEYENGGRADDFSRLKEYLTAERGAIPYAKIAREIGTSEGAARVAVHRLQKRFRALFHAVVADTVFAAEEVEAEVRYVVELLGRL